MSFLDFAHFDFPGSGGLRTLRIHPIWLLLTIAGIQSCSSKSNPAPVEDTLTSGRISVASAAEARTIIDRSFPVERFEPADVDRWESQYRRFREFEEFTFV